MSWYTVAHSRRQLITDTSEPHAPLLDRRRFEWSKRWLIWLKKVRLAA